MAKQADNAANKPWMIRDMPVETRREVKIFATRASMTIAEALDFLVKTALYMVIQSNEFPVRDTGGEKKGYMVRPLQLRNQEEFTIMVEALTKVLHHLSSGTREEVRERSRDDFAAQQELRERLKSEEMLETDDGSADAAKADDVE